MKEEKDQTCQQLAEADLEEVNGGLTPRRPFEIRDFDYSAWVMGGSRPRISLDTNAITTILTSDRLVNFR